MADVSKISINGTSYNIKDSAARTSIIALQTDLSGKADRSALPVNDNGYVDSANLAEGSVNEEKLSAEVLSKISSAAENVIELPGSVSSAGQLNAYTDTNKTYLCYLVPPLANELQVDTPTFCMFNNYSNYQILRVLGGSDKNHRNKTFCRQCNTIDNIWSDFTDITIPDKTVTLPKLSSDVQEVINSIENKADKATTLAGYGIADSYTKAETDAVLSSKYDASNFEYGTGTMTLHSTGQPINEVNFDYQKLGKMVTVSFAVTFTDGVLSYAQIIGLPYIPKGVAEYPNSVVTVHGAMTSLLCVYPVGSWLTIRAANSTGSITVSSDQKLYFTITYEIL